MDIVTERLTLRPWRETDAEDLYRYASDERVGPPAGWPAHKSVEESREIIRTVFSRDGVYAVTLKGTERAVGCIGLLAGAQCNFPLAPDEGELSYWLGVPFWGRGLIPEAARALLCHGFREMGLRAVWCGYFDGNAKSKRVQEKCGFRYHHTEPEKFYALTQDRRVEHVCRLTREEWAATLSP